MKSGRKLGRKRKIRYFRRLRVLEAWTRVFGRRTRAP